MDSFGEAVHRLLDKHGWTLRGMARHIHVDPGHLSRIVTGKRHPTRELAAALDQALDADGGLIALASRASEHWNPAAEVFGRQDAEALAHSLVSTSVDVGNAARLAHEWLLAEPPQLYEVRAGRRIGTTTIDRLDQRVHQLRLLDDHVGGATSYQVVSGELAATATLLRDASYTAPVGRRLLATVGQLCQIAGWVAADAQAGQRAYQLYLAGARAAHAAGDTPGAASNLSSLAYHLANTGHHKDAVLLARTAAQGARYATPKTRALMAERTAWAYARAGQAAACQRALDGADDAFDQRHADDQDPLWVYWLTKEEIDIMAGRCWTQLQRPLRAVPILQHATTGYGDDTPREASLYLSWLAEALVQAHEIDEAAQVARRVAHLAHQANSARATDRLTLIRRRLQPFHGNPDVDALEDQCRDDGTSR